MRQAVGKTNIHLMKTNSSRLFYFNLNDWTWWVWTVTMALLLAGLFGYTVAFLGAIAVTAGQGIVVFLRDRSPLAFSVQLRAAYLLLLLVGYVPAMRWLYLLAVVGTFALVVFGYCIMARLLSLLPWNSLEYLSLNRLRRTFLTAPNLDRINSSPSAVGRAGGLCTIEAQVAPAVQEAEPYIPTQRRLRIPVKTNRASLPAGATKG